MRSLGRVYKRGNVWWIQYSVRGKKYRESSRSPEKSVANRLLGTRLGEITTGRFVGPDVDKTTFDDLVTLIETDYQLANRKSIQRMKANVTRLREFFGKRLAIEINHSSVSEYVLHRQQAGAKTGTIHREVAVLGRMLTLAVRANLLTTRPQLPTVATSPARQGFFERDQFEALLRHLPEYLRGPAHFAYLTGWRAMEIMALRWRNVDWEAKTVKLDPGTTKNNEGRVFPFGTYPELEELLREAHQSHQRMARQGILIPWVFHRDGRRISANYTRPWKAACREAGLPGLLFHDLRRTAVRNLEQAGVPRSVAMKLTGHLTEAVYRRYAIVSQGDLAEGVAKLAGTDGAQLGRKQRGNPV